MKKYVWNKDKNRQLIEERGVCFEHVLLCLEYDEFVFDIIEHPNIEKYGNQKIFIININDYVYLVPFVEDEEKIFLKTIIPSRKYTKNYLGD